MTTIGNASLNWLHVGLIGSNAGLGVLKLENIESKEVIFSNNQAGDGQGGIESYRGGWRDDQVGSVCNEISAYPHQSSSASTVFKPFNYLTATPQTTLIFIFISTSSFNSAA
jgi:hypothetical protein